MLRQVLVQLHLVAKPGQVGKLFFIRFPCRSILDPFAVHAVVIGSVSIQSGNVCVKGQIGGSVIILGDQAALGAESIPCAGIRKLLRQQSFIYAASISIHTICIQKALEGVQQLNLLGAPQHHQGRIECCNGENCQHPGCDQQPLPLLKLFDQLAAHPGQQSADHHHRKQNAGNGGCVHPGNQPYRKRKMQQQNGGIGDSPGTSFLGIVHRNAPFRGSI